MSLDPTALAALLEQRAIETERSAVIDVFDRSLMARLWRSAAWRAGAGRVDS